MRAYEFLKSCEDISRDLDPHLVEIAKKSFEVDHARKYYAPAFFLELYPYLHLFGEHDSFENVDCDNKEDRSKAMKAIFSRLRDPKIDKYRASLLGWLSQVHTEAFFEFIQENNIAIRPLTQPAPFLSVPQASWDALRKAQERRDKRLEATGWVEPMLESNSATEQSSDSKGFAAENNNANSNHLPLIVVGFVGIVFLIWAAWSFTDDTDKVAQTETHPPTNVETAINAPPEENPANDVTEADEVEGDPAQAQDETDNIIEVPDTPVDLVWDEITDREWSIKPITHFKKYVDKADREQVERAAENGNVNAMMLAALGHYFSRYSKHDYSISIPKYVQPACNAGHARACALRGYYYSRNVFNSGDQRKAVIYYQRSCDLGAAQGCYYVGRNYQDGFDSSGKNFQKAAQAFDKSCEGGHADSCRDLARLQLVGAGVPEDINAASTSFQNCAALGGDYCDDQNRMFGMWQQSYRESKMPFMRQNANFSTWRGKPVVELPTWPIKSVAETGKVSFDENGNFIGWVNYRNEFVDLNGRAVNRR